MIPMPHNASDAELIRFADHWAALLEAEDYQGAYDVTDHIPEMKWTPILIREAIKGYGDGLPQQKVTLIGKSTDISQRKFVTR